MLPVTREASRKASGSTGPKPHDRKARGCSMTEGHLTYKVQHSLLAKIGHTCAMNLNAISVSLAHERQNYKVERDLRGNQPIPSTCFHIRKLRLQESGSQNQLLANPGLYTPT